MRQLGIVITFLLVVQVSYSSEPIDLEENYFSNTSEVSRDLQGKTNNLQLKNFFHRALNIYDLLLAGNKIKDKSIPEKRTSSYEASNSSFRVANYHQKDLVRIFNSVFFSDKGLITMPNPDEFQALPEKYSPKLSFLSFIYLYVALIGFYIAMMINLNKKTDRFTKILISSFVFIHSFFIFHIFFNLTNYHLVFPHSYRTSTMFSLLYGPLLYLYFKRITQQYKFKKIDFLHLLPTVLLVIYLYPIYALPFDDKLNILLERDSGIISAGHLSSTKIIVLVKLASLMIYGYFIRKLYLKGGNRKTESQDNKIWQRNIYRIHFLYIIFYGIYGVLIINYISSGFFYHSQVVCMALMVMYIGYSANVQPSVFDGTLAFDNKLFFKYKKSGLTQSLSIELKENIIYLFDYQKIYKENDINLDTIAEHLNTTRHNASQVINEHFKMNFHELVNKYRINEAKSMLEMDDKHNLNIIDIAYEVGYNNKVTFNKAFKKDTSLTPSEYQKSAITVRV